jgi:4-amino-4-deoxy-L-arabinose transferase-like glycosyltransferase
MKQINSERTVTALALLLAAFLGLGLFSQAVHNNSHNEQMYVTAGYLLAQGERLYTDFAFVQTPYSPLIYAAFFRLTGGYYLFTAKLVNFAFLAFAAGLLWLLARRRTRDDLFSAALPALFLANYYLLRAAIEASNYTMPIAFSLAAYALFLRYTDRPQRSLAFFAAGALLAAAVGAKLYYATLLAPFALAALLYPAAASLRSRIVGGLLPLAGGTVAGAMPLLYYAARDWERFAFNNLGYHLLNTTWREQSGFAPMTWGALLGTARDILANPSYLLPVVCLALAAVTLCTQEGCSLRRLRLPAADITLSALLVAVSIVTAFTPQPLFPQYFAMPAPFLLTLLLALHAHIAQPQRRILQHLTLIAAVLLTLVVLPRHTGSLRGALSPDDRWAGSEARDASFRIRARIVEGPHDPAAAKLATVSPVYAIESGLGVYPELSTGSFVLRIGDLLSEEQRARFRATSPSAIAALFDADPPAAILITDEGAVELPLLDYAQSRGYVEVDAEGFGGRLYIKPNP